MKTTAILALLALALVGCRDADPQGGGAETTAFYQTDGNVGRCTYYRSRSQSVQAWSGGSSASTLLGTVGRGDSQPILLQASTDNALHGERGRLYLKVTGASTFNGRWLYFDPSGVECARTQGDEGAARVDAATQPDSRVVAIVANGWIDPNDSDDVMRCNAGQLQTCIGETTSQSQARGEAPAALRERVDRCGVRHCSGVVATQNWGFDSECVRSTLKNCAYNRGGSQCIPQNCSQR